MYTSQAFLSPEKFVRKVTSEAHIIATSVAPSGNLSFIDCQFCIQMYGKKYRGTSHLNLPVFPTPNLLYASPNKLAAVVLHHSIPLPERKPYLQQNIFDPEDILRTESDRRKRIAASSMFLLVHLHPESPFFRLE